MLDVGPVILDEHVGLRSEPLEDVDAARALEVERDRALVAMQVLKVEPVAGEVILVLVLDLDHVGAHLGELANSRRPGARSGEIDDGVRLERQAHISASVSLVRPDATIAGEESPASIAEPTGNPVFLRAALGDASFAVIRTGALSWMSYDASSGCTNRRRTCGRWR